MQTQRITLNAVPENGLKDIRNLLASVLREVAVAARELRYLEQEVTEFNEYYYAEIGPVFETLQRLKNPATNADDTVPEAPKNTLKGMSRRIYRRLAKSCHPDVGGAGQGDFFVQVVDAYKQQDIYALMLLEQRWQSWQEAAPKTPFEEMRQLETWLDNAAAARDYLQNKKEALKESPSYQLRQKIFWAKLAGRDLMAEIRRSMAEQVAQLEAAA